MKRDERMGSVTVGREAREKMSEKKENIGVVRLARKGNWKGKEVLVSRE